MSARVPLALFSATLAATLLVTAPASMLSPIISTISKGKISLANCHGTVWHGGASPLLWLGNGTTMALAGLHWDIRIGALLSGTLQSDIGWDATPQAEPMQLSIHGQHLDVKHLQAMLPAQLIGELSPFMKPGQFNGSITLQSDQLNWSGQQLDGKAVLYWNHAGSALSTLNPLGDYRIELNGKSNNISFVLSTITGDLLLDGQGSWSSAQGLQFYGKASAANDQQTALSELLHHLGPEESPNIHSLSINGSH